MKQYVEAFNKEFQIEQYTFRIRKLNAVEMLGLRTENEMMIDSDSSTKFYNKILSCFEVKAGESWLKVYSNGNYYPAELEDNVELVMKLVDYFMTNFLRPAFTKSDE